MSKSTTVDLRITAKNLAKRTLAEIDDQVELLAKNNDLQASSADRASRSMRDLTTESRQLAAAQRELTRREGMTRTFVEQQQAIKQTANSLGELTERFRQLKQLPASVAGAQQMQVLEQQILDTNAALAVMVKQNDRAGDKLKAVGIDAARADQELGELANSVQRANVAYRNSVDSINDYGAAQRRANDAAAEAIKRETLLADIQKRRGSAAAGDAGRRNEAAVLKADIQARSEAARVLEIQAEAQRRLSAEEAIAAARQADATRRINEAVAAMNRKAVIQAQAISGIDRERVANTSAAQAEARSVERKNKLVALLNSERGQRIAAAEATRRQTGTLDQNTGATDRNARATRQAGTNLALFSDVGRKSLGTYQRLRGQLLGLAAAYIGFYQAIGTAQKAIEATNRNASLQVGLRTINNGDIKAAAGDYAFLRSEADRLGLVFDDLAPNFANIAIAAKALGLNTTQVRDIFSDTATAAAAMNLSVEDTEGVFRAMTQIFSKGKVQAEELRGQLGDRLPGAVVLFARESKIALTDLDRQLKEGEVGIDFLIKGIQGYARQYDAELDNIGTRLQAYINRATNAYNDFLRALLTGTNDQKLKEAFERIETFFRGTEGQKFAEALATAFGTAIDVFIALADNIDLVVQVLKVFVAVQALKAVNDLIIGVVLLTGHLGRLATFFLPATSAAFVAAAGSGGRFTAVLATMRSLMGPLTGLALVLAGAIYKIEKSFDAADARADDFLRTVKRIQGVQGENARGATMIALRERKRLGDQADALEKQLDKTRKVTAVPGGGAVNALLMTRDALNGTVTSVENLENKLALTRQQWELMGEAAKDSARNYQDYLNTEARALKEREAPLPSTPTGTKEEKEKKGPSEKSLRAEENARLNSARGIQKELLDLDQAIFDARVAGEIRTSEQVQQAYQIAVDNIASETEERYLKLQQLAQTAFSAAGVSTPQPSAAAGDDARAYYDELVAAAERLGIAEANNLRIAGERVELLRAARNDQAFELSTTQDVEVIEKRINDLIATRDASIAHINALREAGQIGEIDAYNQVNEKQAEYNTKIRDLVAIIMPLLQAIAANDADPRQSWAKAMIADMDLLNIKVKQYTIAQKIAMNLGAQFASGAASAIVTLGKGIAGAIQGTNSLGDAFKGAMDAFRTFAADFLQQIAQMILQAIILRAIQNAFGGGGGGGYIDAAIGAISNHTGGIVGRDGAKRVVNPAVFAGAGYFHEGGLPGLRSNEVATILKRGEEVVTEDNPRHVGNQSGGGEGVTQVIATFDPADVVIAALSDTRVRKRLFATFGSNKNAVNANLGRR